VGAFETRTVFITCCTMCKLLFQDASTQGSSSMRRKVFLTTSIVHIFTSASIEELRNTTVLIHFLRISVLRGQECDDAFGPKTTIAEFHLIVRRSISRQSTYIRTLKVKDFENHIRYGWMVRYRHQPCIALT